MRYWFLALTFSLTCPLVSGDRPDDRRIALWQNIKRELLSANGPRYFEKNLRDAELPPLERKLVDAIPESHPTELLLEMPGGSGSEVALRLKRPLEKQPASGSLVVFVGIGGSFRTGPFRLTFLGWKSESRRGRAAEMTRG